MSRRVADWLIGLLLGMARPGSPGRRGLDHLLTLPVASIVAYVAFTLMMLRTVDALAHRSPLYLARAAGIPAGWFLLRRPVALGLLLAVSSDLGPDARTSAHPRRATR